MTAPGSIELNEDIIVVINNEGVEILANSSLNGLVVFSRDILTLEEGGEGTSLEVLNELLQ